MRDLEKKSLQNIYDFKKISGPKKDGFIHRCSRESGLLSLLACLVASGVSHREIPLVGAGYEKL